jgi:hypothetical protein
MSNEKVKKLEKKRIEELEDSIEILKQELETLKRKISEDLSKNYKAKTCGVKFHEVILHLTDHKFSVKNSKETDIKIVEGIASKVYAHFKDKIFVKRINEMSNKIERYIRKFYKKNKNVEIEIPLTLKGKKKIVGYPDLYVNTEKESFYLEIKLFGKSQKHQSLRSFYLSTIDKITKTCPHILLAF